MSTLAERLRAGAAHQFQHEQAAIELLIDCHDGATWLDVTDFTNSCVVDEGDGTATINWDRARGMFDSGDFKGYFDENGRAALDFAISLGEDRFRFRWRGKGENHLFAAADRAINWRP
ncbi:hypothetical protein [Nonomuraea angiospora]